MFGQFLLSAVFESGTIKRRDAKKLEDPLRLSFMLGVAIGLLDQLGEVPATMPVRLP